MADGSWIYVIGTPAPSVAPVKIGYTATGVIGRLEQIRKSRPDQDLIVPDGVDLATVEVLYEAEADRAMEKALHSHFREYRVCGEWFSLDPAVARREVRMAMAEIAKAAERNTLTRPARRPMVVRHESQAVPAQRSGPSERALLHRELFEQWTAAGFSEDQALRMIALMTVESLGV